MPYVYGFGGEGSQGGYNTRGSLASGIQGEGSSYQGAGSFNPMTGASESAGYDSRGVTSFVRGIEGGFGGWEGNEYTGPTGETTIDYTYPDNHVRPHAVTARSNGDTFTYDANGNMVSRTQEGVTWTQVFDAENRLVSVSNNATPSTTTTYMYDGSGGRLKRIVNDGSTITTTLYVAGMEIETVGGTETKRTVYYGSAFRIIGGSKAGLYYTHGDHLGSVSVLSDANGLKVAGSDVVYAPFGEVRSGSESELTDFGYTKQRHDGSTGGLIYYKARYYLPGIQHFVSADTIVPEPSNPQAFNRYSYVLNNPVRRIDPSGHWVVETNNPENEKRRNAYVHAAERIKKKDPLSEHLKEHYLTTAAYYQSMISEAPQEVIEGMRDLVERTADNVRRNGWNGLEDAQSAAGDIALGNAPEILGPATIGAAALIWRFGSHHSITKWNNQMIEHGWTIDQINEALQYGGAVPAPNNVNPGNPATRYIHPTTGRSVVVDDVTNEILHIGGDGFGY